MNVLYQLFSLMIFSLSLSLVDREAEAIIAYEEALSLDPRHTTAMTSLARVYRSIGEDKIAEELFKR